MDCMLRCTQKADIYVASCNVSMNVKPMTHISAKNNNIVLTLNQLNFGAGQRQFKSFCFSVQLNVLGK
jgi:hypothetical protein